MTLGRGGFWSDVARVGSSPSVRWVDRQIIYRQTVRIATSAGTKEIRSVGSVGMASLRLGG